MRSVTTFAGELGARDTGGVGDPIDVDRLRRELTGPGRPWRQIDHVESTGSTNADLAARARTGERPGTVLVAGHQAAGRGRRHRAWATPPGSGLAISALVALPERWTWLPLLAGLGVVEGLRACAGVTARLKWPNDVLVEGRKICGILAERVEGPGDPVCVLGLGINVGLAEADLPVPTATSLALLGLPAVPPRTEVALTVLAGLAATLDRWSTDPDGTAAAYRAVCDTVGRTVGVELADDRTIQGRATGVDADGRLRVLTADGTLLVSAGDVVHLR